MTVKERLIEVKGLREKLEVQQEYSSEIEALQEKLGNSRQESVELLEKLEGLENSHKQNILELKEALKAKELNEQELAKRMQDSLEAYELIKQELNKRDHVINEQTKEVEGLREKIDGQQQLSSKVEVLQEELKKSEKEFVEVSEEIGVLKTSSNQTVLELEEVRKSRDFIDLELAKREEDLVEKEQI